MFPIIIGSEVRRCDCGGNMIRIGEVSHSVEPCDDDKFVCGCCGTAKPLYPDADLSLNPGYNHRKEVFR